MFNRIAFQTSLATAILKQPVDEIIAKFNANMQPIEDFIKTCMEAKRAIDSTVQGIFLINEHRKEERSKYEQVSNHFNYFLNSGNYFIRSQTLNWASPIMLAHFLQAMQWVGFEREDNAQAEFNSIHAIYAQATTLLNYEISEVELQKLEDLKLQYSRILELEQEVFQKHNAKSDNPLEKLNGNPSITASTQNPFDFISLHNFQESMGRIM